MPVQSGWNFPLLQTDAALTLPPHSGPPVELVSNLGDNRNAKSSIAGLQARVIQCVLAMTDCARITRQ